MSEKRRLIIILAVVSAALLVCSTALALNHTFSTLEKSIFYTINSWPNSWRLPFWLITYTGTIYMMAALTLFMIWRGYSRLALRIFCGGVAVFLLTQALKLIVERPRPYSVLSDVMVRERLSPGFGFPSTHTAMATVMALLLLVWLPHKWRWVVVLWIVLVGLSRLYLGVHAPLDVVGGFAAGVLVVSVSLLLHNKLTFVRNITHMKLTDKQ
jgi:undecaprenyl-diphosphatase